jgi:hypothetical protein
LNRVSAYWEASPGISPGAYLKEEDMKKNILILAALAVAAPAYFSVQAQADETTVTTSTTVETAAPEVVEKMLVDGTKLHVKGDEVFVVGADGTETAAPDGSHTLSDGTVVKTMGGKVVVEGAVEGAIQE